MPMRLPQTCQTPVETIRLLQVAAQPGTAMSKQDVAFYRKKVKQMGRWTGVRYLRNRGVSFDHAYFILFDRQPRS